MMPSDGSEHIVLAIHPCRYIALLQKKAEVVATFLRGGRLCIQQAGCSAWLLFPSTYRGPELVHMNSVSLEAISFFTSSTKRLHVVVSQVVNCQRCYQGGFPKSHCFRICSLQELYSHTSRRLTSTVTPSSQPTRLWKMEERHRANRASFAMECM